LACHGHLLEILNLSPSPHACAAVPDTYHVLPYDFMHFLPQATSDPHYQQILDPTHRDPITPHTTNSSKTPAIPFHHNILLQPRHDPNALSALTSMQPSSSSSAASQANTSAYSSPPPTYPTQAPQKTPPKQPTSTNAPPNSPSCKPSPKIPNGALGTPTRHSHLKRNSTV
jgi:hypothetical protein